MKKYDVIVYGATGFTGGRVAAYLASTDDLPPAAWALAGRDLNKLRAVRAKLAEARPALADLSLHQASAEDPESLADIAVRARVILTTVGPYERYGKPLVRACVEAGTDYVDLTGEPGFWKEIIDEHDAAAQTSGALIVPCCGFDSIPHDVGAWLVARALRDDATATADPIVVNGYVAAKGAPSGGTWNSALSILKDVPLRRAKRSGGSGRAPGPSGLHFSEDVARWVLPMPTIDPLVVRRSAGLADYGDGFSYRAWVETGSRAAAIPIVAGVGILALAAKIPAARSFLGSLRPPGSGPSAVRRADSWFRVKVVGRCGSATATATISGGDPGYGETSKMIAESALCLALDRDTLPLSGGVVTPAAAMGGHLVARLRQAGLGVTLAGNAADGSAISEAAAAAS
ncbi:MAG: saccharopine dehydrogenase NADP-binding domain-containing protein [Myxococcota bacterium]